MKAPFAPKRVSTLTYKKISKLGTAGYNLRRQEFQRNETMQARVFGFISANGKSKWRTQ